MELPESAANGHRVAIVQTAERAAQLTGRLLRLSRHQGSLRTVVDVVDRMNILIPQLRSRLPRSLDLHLYVRRGECRAMIEVNEFDEAIAHLVQNSSDALDIGGRIDVSVDVVTVNEVDAADSPGAAVGDYVSITVADDGAGMEQERLERMFEPFYSAQPSSQDTGLGLPMVYGFTTRMGGHVSCVSSVGEGTSVSIMLPLFTEEDICLDVPSGIADWPRRSDRRPKVLVVDDEAMLRVVARTQLERAGYEVTEASRGEEALSILARDAEIEVLFTDVVMPDMSGFELAREASRRRPSLRILATSGFADPATNAYKYAADNIALLPKPYTAEVLIERIESIIDVSL